MDKYTRSVQSTVTCFLKHEDYYLLLKRGPHKRIDPNKYNGVGGRVEVGETYVQAAIREIEEETGYKVSEQDLHLVTIGSLENAYNVDWNMCFFTAVVSTKEIPLGNNTEDGELLWIHKDDVLSGKYDLIYDLEYCFKEIIEEKELVFFAGKVKDNVAFETVTVSKLPL